MEAVSASVMQQLAEPVTVAESASLAENARLHVKVQDRYVTVLRRKGQLHAIDSVCFHAGGPLGLGDIEEVNGHACLVCPWHYYKIDIETGDKYYQQMQFVEKKLVAGDWVSNGIQQRTHKVWEEAGSVYVQLSSEPTQLASDQYACMPTCGDRVMLGKGGGQGHNVGGDGKKPSGAILKAARDAAHIYGSSGSGSSNT